MLSINYRCLLHYALRNLTKPNADQLSPSRTKQSPIAMHIHGLSDAQTAQQRSDMPSTKTVHL